MSDAYTSLAIDDAARRELREHCRIGALEFLASTDSTQSRARELATGDDAEWALVVADYQTSGRGQHGRRWSAPPGSSVIFSLVVRPRSPEAMSLIPIRTGLAAAEAIEALLGVDSRPGAAARIELKWPNDLVAGDAKLGGILCEGQMRGSDLRAVVGVGINVRRFAVEPGVIATPAFLDDVAGRPIERLEVLREVVTAIRAALDDAPPELTAAELARYAARDWLADREIVEPLEGRVSGITPRGHLIVHTADGALEEVVAGSVRRMG